MIKAAGDYETFRTELARQIAQAFSPRPSMPRRIWYRASFGRWRTRKLRASLASLDAAEAEYRAREAAYLAALPARMAAVSDEINERLHGVLPEGMRLGWVSADETDQPPPDAPG